ncbi:bifunctional folylpolyglutamate synthase/dihydrofolate synthase [[Clostridium] fimetarium]|uniref:tetrahydrofolate synthase n=1 Tax=[Clostridium] fimetarium TaxID=99656 RepID=A0A1I0MCR8_9FIRM|nr:folylpolyglutamate synthase/dihydrofolate synthase family protein [[Clostridium] fimetarium]SEV86082.1 dihydrofolate synthase / folylpolyglutamate synthase [[Clostridium] fimetarium]
MKYNEVLDYINAIPKYGSETGVVRGAYLLDRLGHPEKKMKVIHVAGTNGKGSVCAYLSNIIYESGYKVGLFISPHLVTINERIQINNEMISDEMFVEAFQVIYDIEQSLVEQGLCKIMYFDYLFAMAMYVFEKEHVEYVVLETGLGGRLDSTNAVAQPIISIITSLSLDHTEVLGDTIAQIAYEKAGIIKKNVPVLYMNQNSESAEVIEEIAREMTSECIQVSCSQWEIIKNNAKHIDFLVHNRYYKSDIFTIKSPAMYQVMNCVIALTAIKVIENNNMGIFHSKSLQKGVMNTFWEGRMEEILSDIYLDGAHNPDGINAFIDSLHSIKSERTCTLLFSVVKDKHYNEMIKTLCESKIFDHLVVAQLEGTRKSDNMEIVKCFGKYTSQQIAVFKTVKEGFEYGRAIKGKGILVCVGSLYLVGEIKRIVQIYNKSN